MHCYNCGAILNRKTRSAEHILPNSIGGKRKAYNLLCKACNEMFGRTIDKELASRLAGFYTMLADGAGPETRSGTAKNGNTVLHGPSPFNLKKKKPVKSNNAYFRSIAKICLNYYLSKGYSKEYCEPVKSFIRGESRNSIIHYYAPENGPLHELAEKEVSHLLHLYGSKDSGVLYGYIELFNMQNLLIIFSMEYDGKDIDVTYCRDVIRNEEITKKVALNLTREQLRQLASETEIMENRMAPRFGRFMELLQSH